MNDRIDSILKQPHLAGINCVTVATIPKPVLVIESSANGRKRELDMALAVIAHSLVDGPCFRCVAPDRLPLILRTGCDAEPSDSVLWIDTGITPDKALEYGGETKVLLILDIRKTERSCREVSADLAISELDSLRAQYPTVLKSVDGTMLWLSRLPANDRRVNSAYEIEHGRWIPGDPFEALIGVVVLGPDLTTLTTQVRTLCRACHEINWQ
jgi:hypothetical protein